MVYNKEKILRIIDFKDTIKERKIQTDIEWLLKQYNEFFIESQEMEKEKKETKHIILKYYDLVDENKDLILKLKRMKKKYKILKEEYRKIVRENAEVAKKKEI